MKNKNSLLAIIAIVIIVLIVTFVILTNTIKGEKTNTNETVKVFSKEQNINENSNIIEYSNETNEEDEKKVYNLNLSTLYLYSMDCINSYNSLLENIYNEEHNINQDGNTPDVSFSKAAFSCLDSIYINNSNVSEENIRQFAGHYMFIPTSGFRSSQENQIVVLFGNRIDIINNSQEEYGYIVQLNETDKVFSIIPYDFMKSAGITTLQEGNNLNLNNNTKVEKKDYNFYNPSAIDANKVASEYFKLFKKITINKPDLAYTKLTSDYRNKYGSVDNFKQYVNDNYEKFNSLRVISATEKTEGEYVTYTCLDNNGENLYLKVNLYNPFEYYIELSNIAF